MQTLGLSSRDLHRKSVVPIVPGETPRGHPLAGRSRGKDLPYRKNFVLSLFFLLAEFMIFRGATRSGLNRWRVQMNRCRDP